MKNLVHLLIVLLFTSIYSCSEEESIIDPPDVVNIPTSPVLDGSILNSTLFGLVLDESGSPIEAASVDYLTSSSAIQTTTNDMGYFEFSNVTNLGNTAYVKINSSGKFEAFRRLTLLEGQTNYTEVIMVDRSIIGMLDANIGGSITNEDGASIQLPQDGIVDKDGNLYNGEVDIAMSWIDPASDELASRMVGDLSGIDSDGNIQALSSYGMLQVELIASNGSLLNLGNNQEATLTFPIPPSMRSNAPVTIPLWSFSESAGIWIEEGQAELEGANYVGSVSHFSSWNVDVKSDPIEIKGAVKFSIETNNGEEIQVGGSFVQIYVCSNNIGRIGGWLSNDGSFRFYNFPKDESFQVKIIDECGNTIYQEGHGPFGNDQDLGELIVDPTISSLISISGNVLDCNSDPIDNGLVVIRNNNIEQQYPISSDGSFNIGYDFCEDSQVTFQVVDLDDLQISEPIQISENQSSISLNDVLACEDLENFVSFNIEEYDYSHVYTEHIYVFDFGEFLEDAISKGQIDDLEDYIDSDLITEDSLVMILLAGTDKDSILSEVYTDSYVAIGFYLHKEYQDDPNYNFTVIRTFGFGFTQENSSSDGECSFNLDDGAPLNLDLSFTQFDLTPGGIVEGSYSGVADCDVPNGPNNVDARINGSFRFRSL